MDLMKLDSFNLMNIQKVYVVEICSFTMYMMLLIFMYASKLLVQYDVNRNLHLLDGCNEYYFTEVVGRL